MVKIANSCCADNLINVSLEDDDGIDRQIFHMTLDCLHVRDQQWRKF